MKGIGVSGRTVFTLMLTSLVGSACSSAADSGSFGVERFQELAEYVNRSESVIDDLRSRCVRVQGLRVPVRPALKRSNVVRANLETYAAYFLSLPDVKLQGFRPQPLPANEITYELQRVLSGPVTVLGTTYDAGCNEYSESLFSAANPAFLATRDKLAAIERAIKESVPLTV